MSFRVTVHYRDNPEAQVFEARVIDTTSEFVVAVHEAPSYGVKRVTYIPWDLIARVETEAR